MEFKIVFVDDHFEVKLTGKAYVDDCRRYFDRLTSHEQWKPGSLVLSDETELELSHLTNEDVKMIAGICGERKDIMGATRFAAYVRSELVYGMNRMLQAHAEIKWDAQIRVFKTQSEALAWLLRQSPDTDG